MTDRPDADEWAVYELTCESCGSTIAVVALVEQWERGATETQEMIEREGETLCRSCRYVRDLNRN